MRVSPDHTQAVIRYVSNYGVKVEWEKIPQDTHTLFKGSRQALNVVHAFIAGREDALRLRT